MWFVYLIENQKGRIYIGFTQNLQQRIERHNRKKGELWTQGRGEWQLIYSEYFVDRSQAMNREKYLKSLKAGSRIKKILNIIY